MNKFWVTKYALTQGIAEIECGEDDLFVDRFIVSDKYGWLKIDRDAFDTRAAAMEAAETMRDKKIVLLTKQITKLEALTF